jgi:hypothetical protein
MLKGGLKSLCHADNKLPHGSAFTSSEHDNTATLSRFFALILFQYQAPALPLPRFDRGLNFHIYSSATACMVSLCFDLRAGCEIKPHEDRATVGTDSSACGRRRAGRGRTSFRRPLPFICVTDAAPAGRQGPRRRSNAA